MYQMYQIEFIRLVDGRPELEVIDLINMQAQTLRRG